MQSSSESSSYDLATTLKSHLECPVCLTVPKFGPIYQCRNGHLLCHQCHQKLQRCPLCKIPLEKLRNLLSEQLVAIIDPDYHLLTERSTHPHETIWQGTLKWKIGFKAPRYFMGLELPNTMVEKVVNVNINTLVKNGTSDVSSTNWPTSLIMQLMPIRIMRQVGKDFFSNSSQVFLTLPHMDDLNALKMSLNKTGVAGVVHFINAPGCDVHVMVLLYSWEKEAFIGFFPFDQINFIRRIRDEIRKENSKNKILKND